MRDALDCSVLAYVANQLHLKWNIRAPPIALVLGRGGGCAFTGMVAIARLQVMKTGERREEVFSVSMAITMVRQMR